MTLSIIFFTQNGEILANKIKDICAGSTTLYDGRDKQNSQSKSQWLEQQMKNRNSIVFIGACGIAVRLIAPFIQNKLTDSPVLVMDELGQYVIPLLSGHVGGANELALSLSEKIGATAVITTATDLENKFAVDVFAKQSGLTILNKDGIAKVSSKILRGEQVSCYIEKEIIDKYGKEDEPDSFQIGHYQWKVPKNLRWINSPDTLEDNENPDIHIGRNLSSESYLNLGIKEYVVGIGCRRGKSQEEITEFVTRHCQNMNIELSQIVAVVSIEVKKDEEGLVGFCNVNRLPFITYSNEVLAKAKGDLKKSAFVESQVGVDNVCERSVVTYISHCSKKNVINDFDENAVCNEITDRLLLRKQAENGMTIAIGKL